MTDVFSFSAALFDMNGILVNDERIHQKSWRIFCQEHGFKLTEEQFKKHVFGRTEKETFEYLFKRSLTEEEIATFSNQRVDFAMAEFKPQMATIPGVVSILEQCQKKDLQIGLATSSRRRYLNFILDGLDLRRFFTSIFSAEDVERGKPDPEVYLKLAAKLGVSPANCFVFEDSISGIRSAQAAGMFVIGVATTHTAAEIQMADLVINSFAEFDFSLLENSAKN